MKSHFEVEGIVNERSKYDVSETMDRIESVIWARGMRVFARINRQLEAEQCCLDMHPSQILIFGDARIETPLIKAFPSLALDLPFRVAVWEAARGEVWVGYNSLDYLCKRHSLGQIPFPELDGMILRALH
jgi:uncharacterized protein (DUF302 family)